MGHSRGYDTFFSKPGDESSRNCQVCGAVCEVRRNVRGPTNFAAAIGGFATDHDRFACPHTGESWHGEALHLVKAIADMPSHRVVTLMRQDLTDILAEHTT